MYDVQVDKSIYYSRKYFTPERFATYYAQIKAVNSNSPKNVLEIGVGDKTVSNYLSGLGIQTTTFDFDENLNPDVVGDLREGLPFDDNTFDSVCAFEVLEHMPYDIFQKNLRELLRVSNNQVIISIPYTCISFEFMFKFRTTLFHSLRRKFNKQIYVPVKIPAFTKDIDINDNGQHYWELGSRGYSKRRVRNDIQKECEILREYHCYQSPAHYFYELRKTNVAE